MFLLFFLMFFLCFFLFVFLFVFCCFFLSGWWFKTLIFDYKDVLFSRVYNDLFKHYLIIIENITKYWVMRIRNCNCMRIHPVYLRNKINKSACNFTITRTLHTFVRMYVEMIILLLGGSDRHGGSILLDDLFHKELSKWWMSPYCY